MRRRAVSLSMPRLQPLVCGFLLSLAHDVCAAVCRVWRRVWAVVLSSGLLGVVLIQSCNSECH